jgi:DNA-binding response OmpR family regulator
MPHRTRVLVVDHNQDMSDSLLALLDSHGYNPKRINSAGTIVADVRDFDPDVIIIDVATPDTNGWDAAREVRQRRLPWGKRPVLIAVSGKYTKGDKMLAEMTAYDYYVINPCDPKALLELVALHARK